MESSILAAYRERLGQYEALKAEAIAVLSMLLAGAGLNIHHVTGRVKKYSSLAEKIHRKPGRYTSVEDVTDIVAVRVITYFQSDVNVVARELERAFVIDWDKSVNKSQLHDPDRFGYMGVHYVVRFPPELLARPELAPFANIGFEVQIRSILQHAWAEIEHDLGYKSTEAVPRDIRRRFYRLAGLFEMADEEFMAIRALKESYARTLPTRLAANPDDVFLDAQSVRHLVMEGVVADFDERIAYDLGVKVDRRVPDDERLLRLTAALGRVGVKTAGQLLRELERREREVLRFAAALMPLVPEAWSPAVGLRPGVSLVHLALWKSCQGEDCQAEEIVDLLDLRTELGSAERLSSLVEQVFATLGHDRPAAD
ncbi:GTP pyrophosphokinase [Deinococcus yavapaiensis]|nr:GTP pyrophosphokinase family protein [Deinococcus yavapaiensis]